MASAPRHSGHSDEQSQGASSAEWQRPDGLRATVRAVLNAVDAVCVPWKSTRQQKPRNAHVGKFVDAFLVQHPTTIADRDVLISTIDKAERCVKQHRGFGTEVILSGLSRLRVLALDLTQSDSVSSAVSGLRRVRQELARALDDGAGAQVEVNAGIKRQKGRAKRKSPLVRQQRPLTAKELQALEVVGRHKQNFAAAARELAKDPATVRENYERALAKMGRIGGASSRSVPLGAMPTDRRGQPMI